MSLPLGLALIGGGTLAGLIGQHQRDRATRRALQAYQAAVNERDRREREAMDAEMGAAYGLQQDRQRDIGGYLSELGGAYATGASDDGAAERQQGVLADIGAMTKPIESYAYSGAPAGQSRAQQEHMTQAKTRRLAEDLLQDYMERRRNDRQDMAASNLALADILREARGRDMAKRFGLARHLRELAWQRQVAQLQARLDNAQRQGQWLSMLGGLGTQIGSLVGLAGMGGGGGGAAGPEALGGTGYYDINSPGALDMTTINPGQV